METSKYKNLRERSWGNRGEGEGAHLDGWVGTGKQALSEGPCSESDDNDRDDNALDGLEGVCVCVCVCVCERSMGSLGCLLPTS